MQNAMAFSLSALWAQSTLLLPTVKGRKPVVQEWAEEAQASLWAAAQPHLQAFDARCAGMQPWQVAAWSAGIVLLLCLLLNWLLSLRTNIIDDGGFLPAIFKTIRSIPFVASRLRQEKAKVRADLLKKRTHPTPPLTALPAKGTDSKALMQQITRKAQGDTQIKQGQSQISGAVYMGSAQHRKLLDQVYSMFAVSNPLHASVFPSVRQMEAEVIAMTARMLGGNGPANPEVCGAMTSGGSESILMAMKAARDWAHNKRGVRRPELVIARSAHAAYYKAAEYFKMRLVTLPVGKDLRLSGAIVRRAINRNTAAVVASAPCYPHGVVDHIESIAKVCRARGIWLHVDACLGGFVLPFARKLGRRVPPFDFSIKGVTSMSADTHKFGLADKGTSVVLYASPEHRMLQFTSITDWSGGLYISPTMAGSRPGALIATAWAAMVRLGEEGYLDITDRLLQAVDRFKEGVRSIPELEIMGDPEMSVVAIKARDPSKLNMYKLNDLMERDGWHWNALQSPPALHFCFTPNHVGGDNGKTDIVQPLLECLRKAVATLVANPDAVQGGSAPMYGMANVVPDRGMVGEFLVAYQDVMLEV